MANVKFPRQEEDLSAADPVLGPPLLITTEMVVKSICKMKSSKAFGPSGVVTEIMNLPIKDLPIYAVN